MKIDKSVVEVLKTSEIDGSLLRLPGSWNASYTNV